MQKREDDFSARHAKLKELSDAELKARFWGLVEQVVDPLMKMGYENTTPSIERSVLLRMGFSSVEVKPIVDECIAHDLLGHGAGNVVYRLSKEKGLSIRDAGLALSRGELWDEAAALFGKGA